MKKSFYNKWLIILLIISIVIPHGIYGISHQVLAAQTGTVTATTLNVRTEPSMTASKVQMNGTNVYLNQGESVTILGEEGDFYHVSLKFNGKTVEGYVHSDYVKLTEDSVTPTPTIAPTATPKPTASPKPTATPTPKPSTSTAIKKEVEIKATVTATTLNVRSGAGTSYSKIASLAKGTSVTVINELIAPDNTEWYGISFKLNGKTVTGYVTSTYIKLTYGTGVKAEVYDSKIKVRTAARSNATYLKYTSGNIIYLKRDKALTLLSETTVAGIKYFKVSFTVYNVKKTGYIEAKLVNFLPTVASPTATPTPKPTVKPTPTPTPKVTPKPTPTPTLKPTPTPTKAPTATPKPTVTPTPTITPAPGLTPSPNISDLGLLEISNLVVYNNIPQPVRGYVCNTFLLNVFGDVVTTINYMLDETGTLVVIKSGQEVIVSQAVTISGIVFYKVDFWYNGIIKTGYVQGDYIYIKSLTPDPVISITPTPTPTPTPINTDNLSYVEKLALEGFPQSYITPLVQLHQQYPNWEFTAYDTGLDWNAVITAESVPGKNLIPNSRGIEWKSLDSGAYNWKTDTFTVYDGTTWVTASKAAISYYMDPRNFLNSNGIFQFELLKYQNEYQNVAGVENILKGTALYNTSYSYADENGVTQSITYGQTFIKAAEYSGVSPYHLASRVKQEVVTGSTTLSASVTGKYAGYEGYYNFYNIGANDSAGGGAIANGLKYAKYGSSNTVTNDLYLIPWINPYKSIVGGSYFIGGSYINRGQDTIYLQKFNVTPLSTYYHQYMSNVEAPFAEAKKVLTAYNGMADAPIVFAIPVYKNMPATASAAPTVMYNPNNRLASLKVLDSSGTELAITPTFSQTELNYYLMVDNSVESVNIVATTVSKKATVKGTGVITLNVGTNELLVPVTAENGDVAKYKVTIIRNE